MRTFPRARGEFQELVNARGDRLRRLGVGELVALGKVPTEHVTVQSRPATIAIIIEPQPSGSVLVVLQGFMRARFISGADVALDGFYKNPDGTVSPLSEGEFYGYD